MSEYTLTFLKTTGIVWFSAVVIGLIFEKLFPLQRNQPKAQIIFNIQYAMIYALVIYTLSPYIWLNVGKIANVISAKPVLSLYFETKTLLTEIAGAFVLFLVIDFFYYWMHRLQHKIPILWVQHSFHHAETAVNATTGVRHHWFEFILQALCIYIPMQVLFKLPVVAWGAVMFIFSLWSFFIHLNTKLDMGILTPVFVGPKLHRIHHSLERKHWDKNFAAYFPIWDILFGTYYAPKRDEYPSTGLHYLLNTKITLWQAFFWPIRQWITLPRILKIFKHENKMT